ncbi:MAG: glutaredoxin family protein [Candidatus Binatia bacterium]
MNPKLTLYSRGDCCLCEEMKDAIRQVTAKIALDLEEIDVDSSAELQDEYGDEVPVLFINGKKAFKYRVTAKQLEHRMTRRALWARLGLAKKGV